MHLLTNSELSPAHGSRNGTCACRLLRFPPKEAVAALIMSSQKTMPFAVSIIALLPDSLGAKGLLTLPPLVSQVSQLFCDIWIIKPYVRKVRLKD